MVHTVGKTRGVVNTVFERGSGTIISTTEVAEVTGPAKTLRTENWKKWLASHPCHYPTALKAPPLGPSSGFTTLSDES